ncbi:hypothetical protein, partial [Corynebacterium riegelii]|uniref:hypothetical protein n=1 Tax=Corynebacterium riegelii TaxID=156976 RepID=UPI0031E43E95
TFQQKQAVKSPIPNQKQTNQHNNTKNACIMSAWLKKSLNYYPFLGHPTRKNTKKQHFQQNITM